MPGLVREVVLPARLRLRPGDHDGRVIGRRDGLDLRGSAGGEGSVGGERLVGATVEVVLDDRRGELRPVREGHARTELERQAELVGARRGAGHEAGLRDTGLVGDEQRVVQPVEEAGLPGRVEQRVVAVRRVVEVSDRRSAWRTRWTSLQNRCSRRVRERGRHRLRRSRARAAWWCRVGGMSSWHGHLCVVVGSVPTSSGEVCSTQFNQ